MHSEANSKRARRQCGDVPGRRAKRGVDKSGDVVSMGCWLRLELPSGPATASDTMLRVVSLVSTGFVPNGRNRRCPVVFDFGTVGECPR